MKIAKLKTNKIVVMSEYGEIIIADDLYLRSSFDKPSAYENCDSNRENLKKLLLKRQPQIGFVETQERYRIC